LLWTDKTVRLRTSPHYQILALCNSSLESTKAAIKAHDLPAETRAYSSPEELAADKDLDLIVVSTRVDTHYGLAKTALNAGKNTFVEWPLGSNASQARELVSLAKEKGVKTVIGLQGRREPSVLKAKEIVESGRLGTIHSVNVHSTAGIWQNGAVGERYDYMLDKKVGGNLLTIYGGHGLDTIFFVHGELKKGYSTLLGNLRPRMHKLASDGKRSEETFVKDTPDQVSASNCMICVTNSRNSDPAPRALRFRVCPCL
jgi:predicted dehydrogenase